MRFFKAIKKRIAIFLFNLAWDLDFMSVGKEIEECGYGYCEDCDDRRSDEPRYCR